VDGAGATAGEHPIVQGSAVRAAEAVEAGGRGVDGIDPHHAEPEEQSCPGLQQGFRERPSLAARAARPGQAEA